MKSRIHGGTLHEDSVVIEGETIDECRIAAKDEAKQRGWNDPWSEKL